MKSMKYLTMIFALLIAAGARGQDTNNLSFRFPVRVIQNQRVDLRNLFAHWRSSTDAVTNSHWIRLTGTIADDTAGGWVVDGKTESASGLDFHQKVLVENPPRFEKRALEALLAQKEQLENGNASGANGNSSQNGNPQKPKHHHHNNTNNVATPQNGSDDAGNSQGEKNAVNQGSSAASPLDRIDKELATIPTMNSPTGAVYSVNFFVFYTGQAQSGMPVVDFGIPTH
jgi:hypothetical protein